MGKIKGWEKREESDFWIEYQNSRNLRRLLIKRMGLTNERSIWFVEIENFISQKEFPTKKEALDFAMQYMRSHPNG